MGLRARRGGVSRQAHYVSSPVHTARCLRREACTVDIEIGPTTGAGVFFPVSNAFALALLHESATRTLYSRPGVVWDTNPSPLEALGLEEILELSAIEGYEGASLLV
jgi:hypothetical protein